MFYEKDRVRVVEKGHKPKAIIECRQFIRIQHPWGPVTFQAIKLRKGRILEGREKGEEEGGEEGRRERKRIKETLVFQISIFSEISEFQDHLDP